MFRFSRNSGGVSTVRLVCLLATLSAGVAQQSTVTRSREANDAGRFFAGLPADAYEYYGIDKYYPEENYDADFDRKNTFN